MYVLCLMGRDNGFPKTDSELKQFDFVSNLPKGPTSLNFIVNYPATDGGVDFLTNLTRLLPNELFKAL